MAMFIRMARAKIIQWLGREPEKLPRFKRQPRDLPRDAYSDTSPWKNWTVV